MTFCDLRNPHNLTAEEGGRQGYIRAERVKMAVCPRLVQEQRGSLHWQGCEVLLCFEFVCLDFKVQCLLISKNFTALVIALK